MDNNVFDTKKDPKFNQNTTLSVSLSESTEMEIKKQSECHEFIKSLIGLIIGGFVVIIGIIIFFIKDYSVDNPIIDNKIIKISASRLSISVFFIVLGIIIIWITSYKYKIINKK